MAQIISNGGTPLGDCPTNWEEARAWADRANGELKTFSPEWSFDCGFKLDFDGPILSVSSRFYPPKTHYGPNWDGSVHIFFMEKEVVEKKFECDTLENLKIAVENYINQLTANLSLSEETLNG